jgi:hypothetical protein
VKCPKRRPRLDARLIQEAKLDFPVAVNAAAAAPNGLCAAVAGGARARGPLCQ